MKREESASRLNIVKIRKENTIKGERDRVRTLVKTTKLPKAWVTRGDQVLIGFRWLHLIGSERGEQFPSSILERSRVKSS